jgi:hypothetical protein
MINARARAVLVAGTTAIMLSSFAPAAGQTPATGRLMREKLLHAQRLLEALTTSNYKLLDQESEELAKIPLMPGWMVLHSPEYRRYSEAFLRATVDLNSAAKQRDLDEAVLHFQTLTASCYQCHRYMKNRRMAR